MPYEFQRIAVPGWDLYKASPSIGQEHQVRFPTSGITPNNRYQLLMYLDQPSNIVLSAGNDYSVEVQMQPGSTSLEFPIDVFPQGAVWKETPAAVGHTRMCLSPAGPMRRWNRMVVSKFAGESLEIAPGEVAVTLTGEHSSSVFTEGSFVMQSDCRVLIAYFP